MKVGKSPCYNLGALFVKLFMLVFKRNGTRYMSADNNYGGKHCTPVGRFFCCLLLSPFSQMSLKKMEKDF